MHTGIPFSLGRMPQLAELRNPDDDWTGKTSAEDRRRRQNRLNQRTQRRKKKLQQGHFPTPASDADARKRDLIPQLQASSNGHLLMSNPERRAKLIELMRKFYLEYSLNAPRPTYLPCLIRLNVLNAMSQNALALGFPVEGLCHDDTISPFSLPAPRLPGQSIPPPSCSESLRPTPVQLAVKHHPWFDLFPFPRMRDNMLKGFEAGTYDEDELCFDLLHVDSAVEEEKPALIVWGQSWDLRSWEASVAFLKKWGWLIQGCPEIIESTNYWRERRGEKKLVFRM
ncbi:hypothetical protein QQX98_003818 [Neonectria punicea]|uniref:BZIP domain-containing protein n=1 Tax=Neonectria punicea TaxID=979145 RepID=A0ABR1HBT8_9HYPO